MVSNFYRHYMMLEYYAKVWDDKELFIQENDRGDPLELKHNGQAIISLYFYRDLTIKPEKQVDPEIMKYETIPKKTGLLKYLSSYEP